MEYMGRGIVHTRRKDCKSFLLATTRTRPAKLPTRKAPQGGKATRKLYYFRISERIASYKKSVKENPGKYPGIFRAPSIAPHRLGFSMEWRTDHQGERMEKKKGKERRTDGKPPPRRLFFTPIFHNVTQGSQPNKNRTELEHISGILQPNRNRTLALEGREC